MTWTGRAAPAVDRDARRDGDMDPIKVGIVIGTLREGRFGERAARWLDELSGERPDIAAEIVDLRDYPLPLHGDPRGADPAADDAPARFVAKMAEMDAYVFVVAEYNHGPTGTLKNATDYLGDEVRRKPAAFLGYGGVGGARAAEQLRLILVELEMAPTRTAVHIGGDAFRDLAYADGSFDAHPRLAEGARATLDQLTWWAATLRSGRAGSDALSAVAGGA